MWYRMCSSTKSVLMFLAELRSGSSPGAQQQQKRAKTVYNKFVELKGALRDANLKELPMWAAPGLFFVHVYTFNMC